METYDLIVIGGGPAGYCAAERAGAAGLSVLLVEKHALGGVCLNEGCIPSKTLLHSAKLYQNALHSQAYGVSVQGACIDQPAVIARKNQVVKKLVAGVSAQMKKHHVTVCYGDAQIQGRANGGFTIAVDGQTHQGKHLLVATGSAPVIPPIQGLTDALSTGFAVTSREILDLAVIPSRLVVIGGGVIGLEMASYYAAVGSDVHVVEMQSTIGGPLDPQVEQILRTACQKKMTLHLEATVTAVSKDSVTVKQGGKTIDLPADCVLLCVGRKPVLQGYGLETLHVDTTGGAIRVDDTCRTNVPGLFAAGDVVGRSMLAHTAYRQAEVAVNTLLGKQDRMRYDTIPAVIYTTPEVACVGHTLKGAQSLGFTAKEVLLPMAYSGRFLAENEASDGLCKLVVDDKANYLLGVHLIGPYASEMIYGAALMLETQLTIEDLKELVFPHPTVSEILRETLFSI